MSKGKFSNNPPEHSGEGQSSRPFRWSGDMDQTAELPDLSQVPDAPDCEIPEYSNPSAMPEVDFHQLTDEDLADLSWMDIPELTPLDLGREQPPLPHWDRPHTEEEEEEEAIKEAFQQTAEKKQSRTHKPKAPKERKPGNYKVLGILSGILVLILVLTAVGSMAFKHFMDPYDHRILAGVSISGVNVGGMTQKEAIQAVDSQVIPQLSQKNMVVSLPEQTLTLSPESTNIRLDVKGAVKAAYRYGRTGSQEQREAEYRDSLTQSYAVDLIPYLDLNDSYVKGQLKTYTMENHTEFIPSSFALEGEQPPLDFDEFNPNNTCQTLLLNRGTPDTALNYDTVKNHILRAYGELKFSLSIAPDQVGTLPDPLDLRKIHQEISIDPVNSALDPETYQVISGS